MNSQIGEAIVLVVVASMINASYCLPMKLNKKWTWENSWFAFSLVGVALVPTVIAMATVPHLWSIYTAVPGRTLAWMAVCGAGWGVNMVLFGLALDNIGMAIAFAVNLGTSAAAGSLVPLIAQHREKLVTRQGLWIFAGILIIFLGVALCGWAGKLRDAVTAPSPVESYPAGAARRSYVRGFLYAFSAGFLGCMLNFGLAFGGTIEEAARERGASLAMMSNAVWLPCLYAGFIPGAVYCFLLMKKNRNVHNLRVSGTWYYWGLAGSMGLLWYGSIILYSISTIKLGDLGPAIGWPLFLSAIVVSSTILGVLIGEWSRAGKQPLRIMALGVGCLVFAIAVLSQAIR